MSGSGSTRDKGKLPEGENEEGGDAKEKTKGDEESELRPDEKQFLVSGHDGKYLMEKGRWPNLKEGLKQQEPVMSQKKSLEEPNVVGTSQAVPKDGIPIARDLSDVLLGWETHGYKWPEDLTIDEVKLAAKQGWLTKEQYLAILLNTNHYSELIVDNPPFEGEPSQDCLGRIFLYDRKLPLLEEWPLSRQEMVEFKGVVFMFCVVSFSKSFERRFIVTASRTGYAILHYYKNSNLEQIDRLETKIIKDRLKTFLDDAPKK